MVKATLKSVSLQSNLLSGVGKSPFINTLKGLTSNSRGAGNVEATLDIKPYLIKNFGNNHLNKTESNNTSEGLISNTGVTNDEFVIWDTPGVSTPKFRFSEFEKTIDRAKCDAFVYFYEVKFNEDDGINAPEKR
jgi:ribosome biogenesis GTPase A